MTPAIERLLARLCAADVRLSVDAGVLRCSAPAGALTPELRDEIAAAKPEIVAFLQQRRESSAAMAIVPRRRGDRFPLSFPQQRLWFLDLMTPHSPAYNMLDALTLTGALQVNALRRAFDALVARHEVLRTTFHAEDGVPYQRVHPESKLDLPLVEGSAQRAEEIAATMAQTPYDLATGPLLRAVLVRTAPEQHVLLLAMHHIISDGWSMGVIAREIAALYSDFLNERPLSLPPLAIQYGDFAQWQQETLTDTALRAQLESCKARLRDAPQVALATDRPRIAGMSGEGAVRDRLMPRTLAEQLSSLVRDERVTTFMLLFAAWNLVLWRFSGERDVVVGVPIANRTVAESEGLIGFFVNTLAMRTRIDPRSTFRELLHQVGETALAAYATQSVPFEKLVEHLSPERRLDRNPLFDVTFTLQNTPMTAIRLEGLTIEPAEFPLTMARFDLETHVWESADGMKVRSFYRTDLFDAATVDGILDTYEQLLAAIVAAPDTRIGEFAILDTIDNGIQIGDEVTAAERALREHPAVRDAVVLTIDSRLEAYVIANGESVPPDAAAAQIEGWRALYDETYATPAADPAFNIAGWNSSYTGAPIPAAEMAEQIDATVARIAMLAERAARILEIGCGTGLLLVRLAPRCERYEATDLSATALRHVDALIAADPRLAHVRTHHRTAEDLSCFEPGSFDAIVLNSVVQYFPGPEYLLRVLHDATALLAPGGAFFIGDVRNQRLLQTFRRSLLDAGNEAEDELERRVAQAVADEEELTVDPDFFAAFAHTRDDVHAIGTQLKRGWARNEMTSYRYDAVLRKSPAVSTTTTTIDWRTAPMSLLDLEQRLRDERPPALGVSFIPNRRIDGEGWHPEAVWRIGERTGYTTEITWSAAPAHACFDVAFHHDAPFTQAPPVIAQSPDALTNRPAAVHARRALAARLRGALAELLPDELLPASFTIVPSFPRTASGDVDRAALAKLRTRTGKQTPYVAPTTDAERTLAAIWNELLGADRIGIHDNFFDRGGHSLLATQLVSRIRMKMGLEISVRSVFEMPQLGALAARLTLIESVAAFSAPALGNALAERGEL